MPKQRVNYVDHHTAVSMRLAMDTAIKAIDISVYNALFMLWNASQWVDELSINRDEVMKIAKVGNKNTYTKSLKKLDALGYITYKPSHNMLIGSVVALTIFGKSFNPASVTKNGKSGRVEPFTRSGNSSGKTAFTTNGTLHKQYSVLPQETIETLAPNGASDACGTDQEKKETEPSKNGEAETEDTTPRPPSKKLTPEQKAEAAWAAVQPSFSEATHNCWLVLCCELPIWRRKPSSALETALKKIKDYHDEFARELIDSAISGNWSGLHFPETPSKYETWKRNRNGTSTTNGRSATAKPVANAGHAANLYQRMEQRRTRGQG